MDIFAIGKLLGILFVLFLFRELFDQGLRVLKKKIQDIFEEGKYETKKGEKVKSKGELKIANFLFESGVTYEYERSLDIGNRNIYPDFYLSDYDVYIEYWGLLGDKKYNFDMSLKKKFYKKNKIKVIDLYPDNYERMEWVLKRRFENVAETRFPYGRGVLPLTA